VNRICRVKAILELVLLLAVSAFGAEKDKFTADDLKGFPEIRTDIPDTSDRDQFFKTVAFDTWQYFQNSVAKNSGLIVDKIQIKPVEIADYTSITNIGLQMVAIISAMDFGFIDSAAAAKDLKQIIAVLQRLPCYNGFFYNWYDLKTLTESQKYISSVDIAWLFSSLATVGVTFPDLAGVCNELIESADLKWLYDDSLHHFYLGYDAGKQEFTPYHYGLLCSESRICLYLGILHGKVRPADWYYQERTLPKDYDQQQVPQGNWKTASDIRYFHSYYEYDGQQIVPSWGGALFEFLMPGLFVNERELAPLGIGENNRRAIQIHVDYASNKKHYPVWGMSSSSIPAGGYGEFGVPEIGVKSGGYAPSVVSPHASILAVIYDPAAVFQNLKTMLAKYPVYGPYGFYDSLDPVTGNVGRSYLALDQAMILISLNNYLNDGKITRRFAQLPGFGKIKNLLSEDRMF